MKQNNSWSNQHTSKKRHKHQTKKIKKLKLNTKLRDSYGSYLTE